MGNRKAVFGIMTFLVCSAVIVGVLLALDIIDPDYQCGMESVERANKTLEVYKKYRKQLLSYPNRRYVNIEFLRDEDTGQRTETWGIVIAVSEIVDQETLPIEDRIQDQLEGVPVQIITTEVFFREERYWGEGLIDENNPQVMLAIGVWNKRRDYLRSYPFYIGSFVQSKAGDPIWYIQVGVREKVHNLGLSPTVRMPECLEGIPVRIRYRGY